MAKVKVLDRDRKGRELELIRRWSVLIKGTKRLRAMKINMKWRNMAMRLLEIRNDPAFQMRQMKNHLKLQKLARKYLVLHQYRVFGKMRSMARRYLMLKFNQNRLRVLSKWSQMANRLLEKRSRGRYQGRDYGSPYGYKNTYKRRNQRSSLEICGKWF